MFNSCLLYHMIVVIVVRGGEVGAVALKLTN